MLLCLLSEHPLFHHACCILILSRLGFGQPGTRAESHVLNALEMEPLPFLVAACAHQHRGSKLPQCFQLHQGVCLASLLETLMQCSAFRTHPFGFAVC